MKNYITFVNDNSGSMDNLRHAAIKDYNANITAVKEAATREMLDTVVSVVSVGYPSGSQVTRTVQISNPHVLKPLTNWSVQGGTPLYDGVGNAIELMKSLPDYKNPEVSFLLMITTDGEESHSSRYSESSLADLIAEVQATGRWTITFRVPENARLHPGDHKNYDIFIQSESTNRKLVGGTGVVYWEAIGVPFTEADEAYLKPKVDNGVAQLPAVPVSVTPTKSPIPVQKKVAPVPAVTCHEFYTRDEAREFCRKYGIPQTLIEDAVKTGNWKTSRTRWTVTVVN